MSASQLAVTLAGVVLIAGLARFFFRRPDATAAVEAGGLQEARVVVRGGYSPAVVQARTGTRLRLTFDRQEDGDCSSRVVFPELAMSRFLAPFEQTVLEFTPTRPGRYEFTCGMNMLRGTLIVEGDAVYASADEVDTAASDVEVAGDGEDVEAAARRAEVADLTRRVGVGALLTLPVLVAVMATDVFGATFVPEVLMNRWVQLTLITPVMFWVGWPIHRSGWLALAHRAADMNSLITLGTLAAFGYSTLVTVAPAVVPADVREVYLEAVGVIVTLILLGRLLEARAKAGTGEAIRRLIGLQPRTARVERADAAVEIPVEDVIVGDIVLVRPGEKVPVDWARIEETLASRAVFLAKLLAGEMPEDIEDAFTACRLHLFPASAADLSTDCTCPDWANPCKHIAATYYLLAEAFDTDPFLILAWRGRNRAELLGALEGHRDGALAGPGGPTRWTPAGTPAPSLEECLDRYFDAGDLPVPTSHPGALPAHGLLLGLDYPPLDIRGRSLTEVLQPAYAAMVEAAQRQILGEAPGPSIAG